MAPPGTANCIYAKNPTRVRTYLPLANTAQRYEGKSYSVMSMYDTRFTMRLISGQIQVGGEINKTMTCVRGKRYAILYTQIYTHHPRISKSNTSYTPYNDAFGDIAVEEENAFSEKMLGFFVPFDAPNTLYYYLEGDSSSSVIAGGVINVVDPPEEPYDLDRYQSYPSHAPVRTQTASGSLVTYTGVFSVARPTPSAVGFSPVTYYYRISIMYADSFEVLYEERNEALHSNIPQGTTPIEASFNVTNSTGLIVKLEHQDPNHNWSNLTDTRHVIVSEIPEDRIRKAGATPSPYTASQQSKMTVRMFLIRFTGGHSLGDPPGIGYLLD